MLAIDYGAEPPEGLLVHAEEGGRHDWRVERGAGKAGRAIAGDGLGKTGKETVSHWNTPFIHLRGG